NEPDEGNSDENEPDDGDDSDGPVSPESADSSESSESPTTSDDEPTVSRSESADAVTVEVDGVVDGRYTADVALAGPSETRPAVSLSELTIETAGDREAFELTVERPTADPREGDAVPNGSALGYVEIGSTLDAADTSAATLRFDVDSDALPEGLRQEDVAVMRYVDGEWTTAGVTHTVDGDAHTATMPNAAPVAVVALEPGSVDIVDSDVPADQVRVGYETTLRATVENPGDRPANRTLTVTMDGEQLAERDVSLDPGESATVQIAFEPVDGGTVSLNGTEAGSISLFGGDEGATDTGTQTEESAPGFGLTAAVLALLVAALAVRVGRR
ncbi:MAG: CARDB domain-containing protein, partial [Halorubrum sp.]|uniref:CARDB domain-containing protein n=1 Tax=Halorubrum sp. TaxID=1879286 RepID=UPI003970E30F